LLPDVGIEFAFEFGRLVLPQKRKLVVAGLIDVKIATLVLCDLQRNELAISPCL
jgi:hypothetical protein